MAPAALDDGERVEKLGFPIGAAARLAPRQGGERGNDRSHVVLVHDGIAEGGLHPPEAEQDRGRDAEILLQPCEQGACLAQAFLAGCDPPIGDAAIEILPELLAEFRLRALQGEDAHVRFHIAHHPVIGRLRYAALERARLEGRDPLREGLRRLLRPRGGGRCHGGATGEGAGDERAPRRMRIGMRRHGGILCGPTLAAIGPPERFRAERMRRA
jgi:hypothetical protein